MVNPAVPERFLRLLVLAAPDADDRVRLAKDLPRAEKGAERFAPLKFPGLRLHHLAQLRLRHVEHAAVKRHDEGLPLEPRGGEYLPAKAFHRVGMEDADVRAR